MPLNPLIKKAESFCSAPVQWALALFLSALPVLWMLLDLDHREGARWYWAFAGLMMFAGGFVTLLVVAFVMRGGRLWWNYRTTLKGAAAFDGTPLVLKYRVRVEQMSSGKKEVREVEISCPSCDNEYLRDYFHLNLHGKKTRVPSMTDCGCGEQHGRSVGAAYMNRKAAMQKAFDDGELGTPVQHGRTAST